MSKMGKRIERHSNSDLVLQDYSEDEFDKDEEITRPRSGQGLKQPTKSILEILNDPNFDSKPDQKPVGVKVEDKSYTLGSTDLLGETAPRRNRREKQREKSQDEFGGIDLSAMLGLDNSQSENGKKSDLTQKLNNNEFSSGLNSAPVNGTDLVSNTHLKGQEKTNLKVNSSHDDIPDFLISSSNQGGGRRRNRGALNGNASIIAAETSSSNAKIVDSNISNAPSSNSPQKALKTNNSLLDLLDRVISNTSSDSKKPSGSLEHKSKKEIEKKKEIDPADSLSSIAMISDTDEEELPNRRSQGFFPQPKAKEIPVKNKLRDDNSKSANAIENKAQADLIKKLTEDLQNATKNFEAALSIEKSKNESLKAENESLTSKIEKLNQDHQLEIQKLHASHKDEMSAMLSTAEATKKLNGLVSQVENTTQMVTTLQTQLDLTNDESLRAREKAVEVKEVHLSRMQEELRNESKTLQEERVRVETYLLELQESIKVSAVKQAQALEVIDKEKSKLKLECEKFEREKDSWQFNFNQQKSTFTMDVENWKVQKERELQEINKACELDRREIATIKASLEANEKHSIVRDQEFEQRLQAERQQFDIEYKIFESERNDLLQKLKVLHRDEAFIKTEKLKLEEKQREIETMSKVFQKDEKDLEFKYASISNMRDDAVMERNRAEKLQEEIKQLKRELEETQLSCQREIMHLKGTKSEFIRQRVENSKRYQASGILPTVPVIDDTAVPQSLATEPMLEAKPRSNFRIDPLDERYRHREPKPTTWTNEERHLASRLEKALDQQLRRFKNSDSDRILARQERILIKTR